MNQHFQITANTKNNEDMYKHQNVWYSSFMSINQHPQGGISDNFCVLTVRSSSQGDGGHVSMYLEMPAPAPNDGAFATIHIELVAGSQGSKPAIRIKYLQLSDKGKLGGVVDPKKSPVELLQTHHACYEINAQQAQRVLEASRRFDMKAAQGRYLYYQGGGYRARMKTALRPGKKGVNCADFIIKILNKLDIADFKYKYKNTPYRVASPL